MNLKSLRIAALAAAFLGSAVAAQAVESGMMDKPVVGQNTTKTSPDTGGPIQKAGATKHGAMMSHKKPKKRSMHHTKPMSQTDTTDTGGPGGKGEPKTGM